MGVREDRENHTVAVDLMMKWWLSTDWKLLIRGDKKNNMLEQVHPEHSGQRDKGMIDGHWQGYGSWDRIVRLFEERKI